eukprot:TRINITY_DN2538_c0_g1_i2.p1 TRINITY_DN2538_c0_g1~~TRINITY_DN2538_c0_g1_i2.p1  ORF type:complete len:315 (-),score=38.44 TRINITY_DN2538_c0_g1_i2:27-971(-)
MVDKPNGASIVQLYRRPTTAEGNPNHVMFSRIPVPVREVVKVRLGGMDGSVEWHRDRQNRERQTLRSPQDRAILFQSAEHVKHVLEKFPEDEKSLNRKPAFGENALVTGLNSTNVCVGDIFHVFRDPSPTPCCILQVSNPRLPCYKVDVTHGKHFNINGVRHYCMKRGIAGWFCRVLSEEGTIKAGDRIELVERKYPKWTLENISDAVYGTMSNLSYHVKEWHRPMEELFELVNMPELGWFEWREQLWKYVNSKQGTPEFEEVSRNIEAVLPPPDYVVLPPPVPVSSGWSRTLQIFALLIVLVSVLLAVMHYKK